MMFILYILYEWNDFKLVIMLVLFVGLVFVMVNVILGLIIYFFFKFLLF